MTNIPRRMETVTRLSVVMNTKIFGDVEISENWQDLIFPVLRKFRKEEGESKCLKIGKMENGKMERPRDEKSRETGAPRVS